MGFSKVWKSLFGNEEIRILMVGLDASGKTTLLHQFKFGEVTATQPTIGFNVETIEYKNLSLNVWDVGGQDKIRKLWRHYYHNTQAVIFVVDSIDVDRMDDTIEQYSDKCAKYELKLLLSEDELRNAVFLIYANKQDMPNAKNISFITEKLGLDKEKSHQWFIQGCSAITGDGIYEGLDWLATAVKKSKR